MDRVKSCVDEEIDMDFQNNIVSALTLEIISLSNNKIIIIIKL